MALYDEYLKKKIIIDHEELQFNKNNGWTLIGIHEEPCGLMADHEYFSITKDLFDRIQSTLQENNISLNIISNKPIGKDSQFEATYIYFGGICKKKRNFVNNSLFHTLQRKRHKYSVDYTKKSVDDFKLVIFDAPHNLSNKELKIITAYFGSPIENQSNEVISKRVMNHILNCWG